MRIIVFGTGSSADAFYNALDRECCEILYFVDNNKEKQSTKYLEYDIEPPEKLLGTEFDLVVIASQYSYEIQRQLLSMGIPFEKIVPYHYEAHTDLFRKTYKETIGNLTSQCKPSARQSRKTRIAVTNYNYSNSNGYALLRWLPDFISDKYEVSLIGPDRKDELHLYDVIVSSNFDGIYNGKHLNIELWHGFPIKRMGMMYEQYATTRFISYQEHRARHIHRIASYSHLYTTFYNACYPTDSKKYRITGLPRNDLLFSSGSMRKLNKITNRSLDGKNIVFYLPTWRKLNFNKWVDVERDWSQLFHFPNESDNQIAEMLDQLDLFLVVKLHPSEYNQYKEIPLFRHERVFLLNDEILEKECIHLYELLPSAKILITDYSSVFFDTLLIDIPVIFAPTDQQEYSENRGFLLEPYQFLTPGPTVHNLDQLKQEIMLCLEGKDRYKTARAEVKQLVFQYPDNQSSLRVWQMIDEFLSDIANHITG